MRALFILLFLSGCATDWSTRDSVLQTIVTATLIADAVTTARIKDHPGTFETGTIARHALGLHPKEHDVYLYFGSLIVFDYFIATALPIRWRPYWQGYTILDHSIGVRTNCKKGLCD